MVMLRYPADVNSRGTIPVTPWQAVAIITLAYTAAFALAYVSIEYVSDVNQIDTSIDNRPKIAKAAIFALIATLWGGSVSLLAWRRRQLRRLRRCL